MSLSECVPLIANNSNKSNRTNMHSQRSLKLHLTIKQSSYRLRHTLFIQNFTTLPTFLISWKCKIMRPFMLLILSIRMRKEKWSPSFFLMSTTKNKLLNKSFSSRLKNKYSASLMGSIILFWLTELQVLAKLILFLGATKNTKKASVA